MKKLFFVAVAAFVGIATSAHAELSVREFLKNADDPLNLAYITGLSNGMGWYATADNYHHGKTLFCEPTKVRLVSEQYVGVLRDYVKTRPKMMADPVGGVLILALQDAFPCPR
ncbi:Rap1a/Tai family immunity protein [Microvirga splendida]|uniref:Rap1a immunity protein domain-containing protein n=1 Tax=Microvirga splendida TaxID=2795727 RepID=A0ABS0Y8C7_9HYPH|nr:Rap1a/Tai family immunity protein [Microvirga splendida]MBJ6128557.1 hypothetical protein [Microvirga splendida]